ncbi:MAG: hypothetical protein J0H12_04665 [Candidatus Paracaedimonas acanthamoebae]|uniref:Serine protease n=1 Tax=Candidatus Paracaedimonas acanthamoebae TaxID=244581 RepID=A0A8J7PMF2_9PROT|nr:hypothetical protein [Candidatus Paracaedimonas acanthamoebae]
MKKLSIRKFVYFLFIFLIFTIPACKASSDLDETLQTEGFTQKVAKKHLLKIGEPLKEEEFNKLFPVSDPEDFSHGWYCGQLRGMNGGRGTGTLIALEEKGGHYIGTGITALHVFLEFYTDQNGVKQCRYRRGDWTFYQNSTSADGDSLSYFSEVDVTEVLFIPSSGKDICIFKGKYKLNGDYPSEEIPALISAVQDNLPKVNAKIKSKKTVDVSLYHYPLGDLYQRENKGEANVRKSTHKVSSLPGSSGAALFSKRKNKFLGIHIGSIKGFPMGVVGEGIPNSPVTIVKKNSFNVVTQEEIESMLQSPDDLHKIEPKLLYAKLVPEIYPETFYQPKEEDSE